VGKNLNTWVVESENEIIYIYINNLRVGRRTGGPNKLNTSNNRSLYHDQIRDKHQARAGAVGRRRSVDQKS
jgi:hypothetical protein